MGVEIDEQFSDEEKVILGEKEEPEASPDTSAAAPEADAPGEAAATVITPEAAPSPEAEAAADPAPVDPPPETVPYSRLAEVVAERNTTGEKHNELLTLGREKYFEKYPDERPADAEPAAEDPAEALPVSMAEAGDFAITGGQFDGMTLREVHAADAFAATALYNDYVRKVESENATNRTREETRVQDANKEIQSLGESLAGEMFGTAENLTKEQIGKVDAVIKEDLDWMRKTGRGGANLADVHYLRTREQQLAAARTKGATALVDSINKGSVPSIDSSSTGGSGDNGHGRYESMDANQFAAEIENMPQAKFDDLMAKAPASLKAKFPGAAWD